VPIFSGFLGSILFQTLHFKNLIFLVTAIPFKSVGIVIGIYSRISDLTVKVLNDCIIDYVVQLSPHCLICVMSCWTVVSMGSVV
jgi:hypothetical protein